MKNSTIVNQWLDACAEMLACLRSDDPDIVALAPEHSDRATELWRACLNDGWAIAELDEIYGRRFNVDVAALRRS
jgi:hypothetical protein